MTVPTLLFVCPTSHMDWDWTVSFEEYYKTYAGSPDSPNPARGTVQSILDAAVSLVGSVSGQVCEASGTGYEAGAVVCWWRKRSTVRVSVHRAAMPSASLTVSLSG